MGSSKYSDDADLVPKSRSLKEWYRGDPTLKKPYCGNHLSYCQFILVHLCLGTLIFFGILIPVLYFVVVPNMIQNGMNNKPYQTKFDVLNITDVTDSSSNFYFETKIKTPSPIPGVVTIIGPTKMVLGRPSQFNEGCVEVVIQENIEIKSDALTYLNVAGNMKITDMDTTMKLISGGYKSTDGYKVQIKGHVTIKYWGVVWYSKLPLNAIYDISPDSNQLGFGNGTSGIPYPIRAESLNDEIRSLYKPEELIPLGPWMPDLYLDKVKVISFDAKRMVFNTTASFENPMTTQMNLTSCTVSIGTDRSLVEVTIAPQNGKIWEMANSFGLIFKKKVMTVPLVVTFDFKEPGTSFVGSMVNLATQLTSNNSTLRGPFKIMTPNGGNMFEKVTKELSISLPGQSLATAVDALQKVIQKSIIPGTDSTLGGLLDNLLNGIFSPKKTA